MAFATGLVAKAVVAGIIHFAEEKLNGIVAEREGEATAEAESTPTTGEDGEARPAVPDANEETKAIPSDIDASAAEGSPTDKR
jgi:hypothetical protein